MKDKPARIEKRRQPPPGEVRCECGALLFRALGPALIEVKCRRCGKVWKFLAG